jgi:hypothetical protein
MSPPFLIKMGYACKLSDSKSLNKWILTTSSMGNSAAIFTKIDNNMSKIICAARVVYYSAVYEYDVKNDIVTRLFIAGSSDYSKYSSCTVTDGLLKLEGLNRTAGSGSMIQAYNSTDIELLQTYTGDNNSMTVDCSGYKAALCACGGMYGTRVAYVDLIEGAVITITYGGTYPARALITLSGNDITISNSGVSSGASGWCIGLK